jgi:hypothetical protein
LASTVTVGRATAVRLTGPERNATVRPLNVLPRALIVDAMVLRVREMAEWGVRTAAWARLHCFL